MKRIGVVLALIVTLCMFSCAKQKIAAPVNSIASERYGSEFPAKNATDEIERITRSVKKIYSVSSYITYQFKKEARITGYQIHQGTYKKAAWGVISTNETVFGTGTIIGCENSAIALLTCAHVVISPDTLVTYFEPADGEPDSYIHSFSVREKQENWVKDLSSCGPFMVVASDPVSDIAILGINCKSMADTVMPFPYSAGHAKELGWGSFVYIFGYPMGNQVITKGLVSLSAKRPMGEFSIDALLNKGYSGGVILALRNGVPNFELVGMVKTVNSSREEFLKPASDQLRTPEWLPYHGDIYVGKSDNIQYGLNSVVPIEAIFEFFQKYREEIISTGYNLNAFFQPYLH